MPARKPEQEKEVLDWIEAVLGEPLPKGDFEEVSNIQFIIITSRVIFPLKFESMFCQSLTFLVFSGSKEWSDFM